MFGAPGSLKEGDEIYCVDNDTNKKLSGAPKVVDMVCKADLDEFRKKFRENIQIYVNHQNMHLAKFLMDYHGVVWGKCIL